MSKIEQEIIDGAAITQGSESPITDIEKIKQVMVAYKLLKKDFTGAALKKLLKRYTSTPTDEDLDKLRVSACELYDDLKMQQKIERENIRPTSPLQLPDYIFELTDEDGFPTGVYQVDYMKYSDFLSKRFRIHNLQKNLFVYDESTCTYKSHVNQIETHTRNIFKEFHIPAKLSEAEHETLTHIKSMGCSDQYPFLGKFGTVHVLNGCLDLKTGMVSPTTPDMLYDYRIETKYKSSLKETPELDEFLKIYGTTEPINVLAKCIWQRAYHDTVKELTVFLGPRDCGKTTLAELIQVTLEGALHNRSNVSRILLHDLLQRFGYADLEGKLLNFGDDLPDMFIKNSGRLNELVGSVVRHIEKKGLDGYDAIVTAYYLFTANNLPPLDDDDNVIWGKIHLVEFNNVIAKTKVPRTELFTETLREQLLFRAVETAMSYNKTPYENDQSPEDVRTKWHESTTDVDSFLIEGTETDAFALTPLEAIKSHYERWCTINHKKRHMKYLNKMLKPYFKRTSAGNVYMLKLNDLPEPELPKDVQTSVLNSQNATVGTVRDHGVWN